MNTARKRFWFLANLQGFPMVFYCSCSLPGEDFTWGAALSLTSGGNLSNTNEFQWIPIVSVVCEASMPGNYKIFWHLPARLQTQGIPMVLATFLRCQESNISWHPGFIQNCKDLQGFGKVLSMSEISEFLTSCFLTETQGIIRILATFLRCQEFHNSWHPGFLQNHKVL